MKFELRGLPDFREETLLGEIRRVAILCGGRKLTRPAFKAHAKVSVDTIIRRFGSWQKALARAGLADRYFFRLPERGNEALLEELRRVARLVGSDVLTRRTFQRHSLVSADTILRHFGSWESALKRSGLVEKYAGSRVTEKVRNLWKSRRMSRQELTAELRRVAGELGKAQISLEDVKMHSKVGSAVFVHRFGSWRVALAAAGLTLSKRAKRHTDEEYFENLLRVWTHCGRQPLAREMVESPSTISGAAYEAKFGSWRKALESFIQKAKSDVKEGTRPSEPTGSPVPVEQDDAAVSYILPSDPMKEESPGASPSRASDLRQLPVAQGGERMPTRPRRVAQEDRHDIPLGLRYTILKRDHFRCVACGASPATDPACVLHVDHIVPFSAGGKTVPQNLRILCGKCNMGKGGKPES